MKDFHITIRVKNNQIVERRERLGLTVAKFAILCGIPYSTYLAYENLRIKPLYKTGEMKPSAQTIINVLDADFKTLWPELILSVKQNSVIRRMDVDDIGALTGSYTTHAALPPSELFEEKEFSMKLVEAINDGPLTEREGRIVKMRYGLDGYQRHTYDEIGKLENVCRERARQIIEKALRKMRHSTNFGLHWLREYRK